jgi:hypothetical protein
MVGGNWPIRCDYDPADVIHGQVWSGAIVMGIEIDNPEDELQPRTDGRGRELEEIAAARNQWLGTDGNEPGDEAI